MKNHRTMNTTVRALQHCPCSPRGLWAFPRRRKLTATRRKVPLTARGTASPSILFGKKKKIIIIIVKKKGRRGTQAALSSAGCGAQNWPALLGSHCRRRTMDGSLLAPRMNSSRDSFPSLLVSIWRKIFSVLFSGVDSSSGIFITEETIL